MTMDQSCASYKTAANFLPGIEASKIVGHKREAEAGTIGVLGRPDIRFVGERSQIL